MTEWDEPAGGAEPDEEERVRSLLKRSLRHDAPEVDVLGGVQKKLRERSRGKFYADRWSTAKHPPIFTYLVTSTLMLVIALAVYALITPLVGEPEPVRNEPAPVRVLPPR